jgi:hypothetical protein
VQGFDYELGYAKTCRCQYSYDIDGWWLEKEARCEVRRHW